MTLDPTDYTTWTTFSDHPIFGDTKFRITEWSHDPSRYCELLSYGHFMPECYVHILPTLPVEEQQRIADRDIRIFANACAEIERIFGEVIYELVILDDFTAYLWVKHSRFEIELYTGKDIRSDHIITMFIDSPDVDDSECACRSTTELVTRLQGALTPAI